MTKKITKGLSRIQLKLQDCLYLGNINSLRDWGHARDYVEMQWRILQHESPDDYVIATGKQTSVRDFIELTARELGWGGIEWTGKGEDEVGKRKDNGKTVIKIDPKFYRPAEVETLLGDPSKAKQKLGWEPQTSIEDLVKEMVKEDLIQAEKESYFKNK